MRRIIFFFIIIFSLAFSPQIHSENKPFTLVLDAGHGGKEPGAMGKKSSEKDINLSVTLKVGKMIEDKFPDVKVIYTRKDDSTVSLPKRSQIANNAKADLFISIHANSTAKNKTVNGAEVFTYGVTKTNANLEVLQRENEIVYLEDEFKDLSIADFLNSTETAILIGAMQQVYHDNSYDLASMIQKELVSKAKRKNRGVKSDNFAVLRNAAMPSVLIELDFISCPEAENYMISKQGQQKMSECIFNAFSKYKNNLDIRSSKSSNDIGTSSASRGDTTSTVSAQGKVNKKGTVYKIQILASPKPVEKAILKGYDASYYIENDMYKYTYGESSDLEEIKKLKKKVSKDFEGSFIVTFENGIKK